MEERYKIIVDIMKNAVKEATKKKENNKNGNKKEKQKKNNNNEEKKKENKNNRKYNIRNPGGTKNAEQ